MKPRIYHTPIQVRSVCKNGSERLGVIASCNTWTYIKGKKIKMEYEQKGKTKAEALGKVKDFLSSGGKYNVIEEA